MGRVTHENEKKKQFCQILHIPDWTKVTTAIHLIVFPLSSLCRNQVTLIHPPILYFLYKEIFSVAWRRCRIPHCDDLPVVVLSCHLWCDLAVRPLVTDLQPLRIMMMIYGCLCTEVLWNLWTVLLNLCPSCCYLTPPRRDCSPVGQEVAAAFLSTAQDRLHRVCSLETQEANRSLSTVDILSWTRWFLHRWPWNWNCIYIKTSTSICYIYI